MEVDDKGIGTGELVGRVRTGEEERQEHRRHCRATDEFQTLNFKIRAVN